MKYTNPLQAKILLFSTLYDDFDFTSQAWSNLKRHDLDSLLRRLLSLCKTYTDLEACLFGTARRSSAPETAVQTAEAVIKCLRSFYLYSSAAQLPANPTEPTQLKLDDFEETTLEFISITDEDDYTCQLLPPAAEPTGIFDGSPLEDKRLLPASAIAEDSRHSENVPGKPSLHLPAT